MNPLALMFIAAALVGVVFGTWAMVDQRKKRRVEKQLPPAKADNDDLEIDRTVYVVTEKGVRKTKE